MGRRVSIPVRVVRSTASPATSPAEEAAIPAAGSRGDRDNKVTSEQQELLAVENRRSAIGDTRPEPVKQEAPCEDVDEWRDRALRLQADMENYRKRQQRIAQDQIVEERSRLLNEFLDVVDDLERALASQASDGPLHHGDGIRRGVELTHRAAMRLLEKEGATAIAAEGQPFDPNWHEAVATVPRDGSEVALGTVVKVVEPGYRIGDQLLRPAKVIVAA
jgi:molecular chaperone GrpE (heat shock protein)